MIGDRADVMVVESGSLFLCCDLFVANGLHWRSTGRAFLDPNIYRQSNSPARKLLQYPTGIVREQL